MDQEIQDWLRERLGAGPQLVRELLDRKAGGGEFHRRVYYDLQNHLRSFLDSPRGSKWIIMPGMRGVGKTTLLAQLFNDPLSEKQRRIYLSLDTARRVGADMIDVEKAIEAQLGHKLEANRKPVLIFLDEVHFLSDWSLTIKTWVDNSDNLFILCTGSSAITLQSTTDGARRSDTIKVGTLSFPEFIAIRQTQAGKTPAKLPPEDLGRGLEQALFQSKSVVEANKRLEALMPQIDNYWSSLHDELDINQYLLYGTLPFALSLQQTEGGMFDFIVWERIMQTMDNVLLKDIAWLEKFDSHVLASFPKLLFLLTRADSRSLHKLARNLKLNIATVQNMLAALAQSEVIMDIKPWGYGSGHVRKAHKYLFVSPATRTALVNELGSNIADNTIDRDPFKGHLMEDAVAAYLKRIFVDRPVSGSLEYDISRGGADFIVSKTGFKKDAIVIEVGANKMTSRQVVKTLRAGGRYGMVITGMNCFGLTVTGKQKKIDRVILEADNRVIQITLSVFLLL